MANIEMPPVKSKDSSRLGVSAPEQQLHLTRPSLNGNETSDKKYTCHHYASKVLQNFNFLRQNTIYCDVEIVAGGRVMKAHRALLSASSQYFHAMFTTGLVEKQMDRIELHDIPPHILSSLIDFIYTGEININQDNVQDLIVAADMLELKEVVVGCTEFLKYELHATNAVGIYRFAEGHNCEELANMAVEFIQLHFPQICKEEEFFELPKELLTKFLSSEHLRVDTEFQVFKAAMGWIMHDVRYRRRYVSEILSHVRLPLLSLCLFGQAAHDCRDKSLKGALFSVYADLVTKKESSVPLHVQPRLCAKKDILVIGGSKKELVNASLLRYSTYSLVERFDTFHRKWCRTSPMGIGRNLPGVATLNGRIFVVGGRQDFQPVASSECYDPREDTWSEVASMVVPRYYFGLCALYGNLYAFGGLGGEDIGGSIEKYDPAQNEWILEGDLPEPRFSMGVVSYDGLIYIVGGRTHSCPHLQDLLSFNPVTGEWSALPPMLVPRSHMGVAVLDGYLYVVGGSNRHRMILQSVERYSFEEKKWSEVSPMKVGRKNFAVASANGLLFVIGGQKNICDEQQTISCVECYDPLADTWHDCPPLPDSRSDAAAIVV